MINSRLSILALFLITVNNAACSYSNSELYIDESGKLHLGDTAYSLDPKVRSLFKERFTEKEFQKGSERVPPGVQKLIVYEIDKEVLFEVEIHKDEIYRINIYSSDIRLHDQKGESTIGKSISKILNSKESCEIFYGENPGSYIKCKNYANISFYTECEGDLENISCNVDSILLTSY